MVRPEESAILKSAAEKYLAVRRPGRPPREARRFLSLHRSYGADRRRPVDRTHFALSLAVAVHKHPTAHYQESRQVQRRVAGSEPGSGVRPVQRSRPGVAMPRL